MIRKQPISVTLHRDNVAWLKGRADVAGYRGISELLDRLVSNARMEGRITPPRSVVGTIDIDPSDEALDRADAVIRDLFGASLNLASGSRDTIKGRKRRRQAKTTRRG